MPSLRSGRRPIFIPVQLPPLLECVPNVSEGRDLATIEALTAAITSVPNTTLLHRDIGYDANRTVFTFVGSPESVCLSAKRLARACVERIDLTAYSGTHPYIGALDVCPFVPLWGLSPKHATAAALELAEFCASELTVPVYLYEHSATRPRYRSLAQVRKGGLRAVRQREAPLGPDFGEGAHPTAGASVIGARDILVAFNINLSGDSAGAKLASKIAAHIRSTNKATGLPKIRAIGWQQPALGRSQVSVNLLDYNTTGLAEVYQEVDRLAKAANSHAAGSELIGLLPLDALAAAGRHYLPSSSNPHELANVAAQRLGLDSLRPWDAEVRVLEYIVQRALG